MELFDFLLEDAKVNIPLANKIEIFHNDIKPKLNERQTAVLSTMKQMNFPCTMHEVAEFMQVPLNTISGRFSELKRMNKITAIGRTNNTTGKRKTVYALNYD